MLKQYFFIWMLITASLNTTCMEYSKKFNPQNTKFAFDFHGVIATDPLLWWKNPINIKNFFRWNFVPEINQQLPLLLYIVINQIIWHGITGEGLRNFCAQHGQKQVVTGITEFANDIDLLTDTVAIMKELKASGYELDLASNIDSLFLNDLEKNDKYTHIQEVLALFTNKKFIDYSLVNSEKPTRKPDILYFIEYHQQYNQDAKQIIFIDDRLENVEASEQTNMIGIHFQNPEQFRNELVTRGILQQNKK